ncbi:MAG: M28 family peptidase [Kiritimatiellae bacterium]|nr:M28 family peptidase [Kiritimatiellia bacterium]
MLSSFILAAAVAFGPAEAKLAHSTAKDLVAMCTPRDAGTVRGRIAANFLLDAASRTGADVVADRFVADTPRGRRTFTNLVAEFRFSVDAEWVVLVSHFDTKPGVDCPGANDGASTSGLLVALAQALRSAEAPHANVMLLWTDGEECMKSYTADDGLWGSRHAARKLKESGRKVKAVVCLDMLGDADLNISLPRNTSPALRRIALFAAKKAGLAGRVAEIPELVRDDHSPFLEEGFKSVVLIDFEYGGEPGANDYWHTEKDTIDHVSEQSLLASGRLVAGMLGVLLSAPPANAAP